MPHTSSSTSPPARLLRHACVLCALALPLWAHGAGAQSLNQLQGVLGSGTGSSLGGLGGGLPSVGQAGASNTAGVLEYCIRNNYVNGDAASSVKDAIVGKIGGGSSGTGNSAFKAGNSGMLQTGNGKTFGLGGSSSGGGIKSEVTHKVCDMVLQHAKSML